MEVKDFGLLVMMMNDRRLAIIKKITHKQILYVGLE